MYSLYIRRPESACSSNNFMQNPNLVPKSKILNPESEIQNPKSKRPRLGLPQKERILRQSKIQDPKSKIRNRKSKIQNPRSKIQNPKSKLQNPNSKIQNPNGRFGFWFVSKRSEARFSPYAAQIGLRFPQGGFAGNRASVSSPVSWKPGPSFQRKYHEKSLKKSH